MRRERESDFRGDYGLYFRGRTAVPARELIHHHLKRRSRRIGGLAKADQPYDPHILVLGKRFRFSASFGQCIGARRTPRRIIVIQHI